MRPLSSTMGKEGSEPQLFLGRVRKENANEIKLIHFESKH